MMWIIIWWWLIYKNAGRVEQNSKHMYMRYSDYVLYTVLIKFWYYLVSSEVPDLMLDGSLYWKMLYS